MRSASPHFSRALRCGNGTHRSAHAEGFTIIEVLVALAILGGLLATLIVTTNYHLGVVVDLERRLRLQDAADRFLEEISTGDGLQMGEQSGTLEPGGYSYHLKVQPAAGPAAGIGVAWVQLTVEGGSGERHSFDVWVPQ